jgi:hypothetical protein
MVLKFHDFSKSIYRGGFDFTMGEDQIKFRTLFIIRCLKTYSIVTTFTQINKELKLFHYTEQKI